MSLASRPLPQDSNIGVQKFIIIDWDLFMYLTAGSAPSTLLTSLWSRLHEM